MVIIQDSSPLIEFDGLPYIVLPPGIFPGYSGYSGIHSRKRSNIFFAPSFEPLKVLNSSGSELEILTPSQLIASHCKVQICPSGPIILGNMSLLPDLPSKVAHSSPKEGTYPFRLFQMYRHL